MTMSRKYVLLWWGGAFHDKPALWHVSIFHLYRHMHSSFMQCTNEESVCPVLRYTASTAGLIHQTYTYLVWVCENITLNTWEVHWLIWSQTTWVFLLSALFPKINVYRFIFSMNLINKAENVEMWKHGINMVHEHKTEWHHHCHFISSFKCF